MSVKKQQALLGLDNAEASILPNVKLHAICTLKCEYIKVKVFDSFHVKRRHMLIRDTA